MAPITYAEVKEHPDTFLTLTGLSVGEFREFLPIFGSIWTKTHAEDELARGRPPVIKSMQDRLLFILFHYKCNPLQELLGYLFGMSQERASETIQEYTDMMLEAVRQSGLAPERISEDLKKNLNKIHKRITSLMEPNGRSKDPKSKKNSKSSTVEKATNTPSRTI